MPQILKKKNKAIVLANWYNTPLPGCIRVTTPSLLYYNEENHISLSTSNKPDNVKLFCNEVCFLRILTTHNDLHPLLLTWIWWFVIYRDLKFNLIPTPPSLQAPTSLTFFLLKIVSLLQMVDSKLAWSKCKMGQIWQKLEPLYFMTCLKYRQLMKWISLQMTPLWRRLAADVYKSK